MLKPARLLLIILSASLGISSCATFPQSPPAAGPVTYTIQQPLDYNCYLNHAGTGRKIKLYINVITKFFIPTGPNAGYNIYADNDLIVDPSVTPFPITITVDAPSTESDSFYLTEVNIQGEECSTCANGWGYGGDQPSLCAPFTDATTNPVSYRAAKPRWNKVYTFPAYHTAENLPSADRIMNVPNTCGCTVN